jgi:isocitrate lyase
MKAYIEAGAAGVHFEDQLASEKKCGHMGGKVLIPTAAHERNLIAARLAADVCGTPTFVLARTDAESAKLITADVDERDREFITGERTAEGFFRLKPGTGLAHCIKRGIAFAKYADLLWWETSTPNLEEAKEFAEAVHKVHPGKMLAYNCSPSFNWEANIDKATIAKFQREIGAMGYKFQFVTLAGFHSLNHGMFELARGYKAEGMAAYSRLQQAEFASEKHGYSATRHQREVGTGYFDLVSTTITGGTSSTTALHDDDQRQQFLGDWRRVRFDELPQARGRLGPGAGSLQDPQGSRGCLARGLGREPSQGRRAFFHRGRARPRLGLTLEEDVQGRAVPSGSSGWGRLRFFQTKGVSHWEQRAFAENAVTDRLRRG